MKKQISKEVSKYMSKLGKLSQKKNPKTKEDFARMARRRWNKQPVDKPIAQYRRSAIISALLIKQK